MANLERLKQSRALEQEKFAARATPALAKKQQTIAKARPRVSPLKTKVIQRSSIGDPGSAVGKRIVERTSASGEGRRFIIPAQKQVAPKSLPAQAPRVAPTKAKKAPLISTRLKTQKAPRVTDGKGFSISRINDQFTGVAKVIFNKALKSGQDPSEVAPGFFGNQASERQTLGEIRKALAIAQQFASAESLGLTGESADLFDKAFKTGQDPSRFVDENRLKDPTVAEAVRQAQEALNKQVGGIQDIEGKGAEEFAEGPEATAGAAPGAGQAGAAGAGIPGVGAGSPLEQALLGALQPSQQEQDIQQALAGSRAGQRQGEQDISQQAIPLPFITGQRAAIAGQAGVTQANLTDQLALAQQARKTTADVAGAQLGFQQQREQRATQERQFNISTQLAAAGKGLRFDPETGEFSVDPTASAPDQSESLKVEEGLRKEFTKASGEFVKVRDAFGRIQAAASDPSGAGDLALIFNFMKMLDPGSTVREGEFATAQNSASVPDVMRGLYNKVVEGTRLGEAQRTDFVDRSNKLFTVQNAQHKQRIDVFGNLATNAGVNSENVTINLGLASGLGGEAAVSGVDQNADQLSALKLQLRQGEILIERNGEVGAIPQSEFDPSTDKKL